MKQSTEIQIDLSVFYRLFIKVSRIRVKYCLFSQVQDENMSFMVYKTQTKDIINHILEVWKFSFQSSILTIVNWGGHFIKNSIRIDEIMRTLFNQERLLFKLLLSEIDQVRPTGRVLSP